MQGARPVAAPRGTTLTARGVAAGGRAAHAAEQPRPRGRRAARRPRRLRRDRPRGAGLAELRRARAHAARRFGDDETMLVQSGRPVGVVRTHEWAPRVLLANSNLVGDWSTWEEFRRLEAMGLTMYGQMTAGSWIYIGTQGILQGTYETFAAVARSASAGRSRGTLTLTGRRRRHGRRPAARGHDERRGLPAASTSTPPRLQRRVEHRYLDEWTADLDEAIARVTQAKASRVALSRRAAGQRRRRVSPSCSAAASRSTSSRTRPRAHDPLSYLPEGIDLGDWHDYADKKPDEFTERARLSMARHVEAMVGFLDAGAEVFDYGNSICGPRRARRVPRAPSSTPASSRPTSARSSARARDRSGGWRCPATRADIRAHRPGGPRAVPRERGAAPAGSPRRRSKVAFQGLPARICWLGYGERDRAGVAFNDLVATRRAGGPDRDRPRPPRLRLGRLAVPRDRVDARRLRRDRGLAAAQRAASTPRRAPRGCRSTTAAASASAARCTPGRSPSPTAPRSPARRSPACSRTTRGPGSSATSTPATPTPRRSPRHADVRVPMREGSVASLAVSDIGELTTNDPTARRRAARPPATTPALVLDEAGSWVGRRPRDTPPADRRLDAAGRGGDPGLRRQPHPPRLCRRPRRRVRGAHGRRALRRGRDPAHRRGDARRDDRRTRVDARSRLSPRCAGGGTTTVEVKSGYDLTVDGERRLSRSPRSSPSEVTLPRCARRARGVRPGPRRLRAQLVGGPMLEPARPSRGGSTSFCDPVAFSVDESRAVLVAGPRGGARRCDCTATSSAHGGRRRRSPPSSVRRASTTARTHPTRRRRPRGQPTGRHAAARPRSSARPLADARRAGAARRRRHRGARDRLQPGHVVRHLDGLRARPRGRRAVG